MGKFSKATAPTDPSDLARSAEVSAQSSLQSSLFQRLKKKYGASKGGVVGWMMIRLAQPTHADHGDACDEVLNMTVVEIGELVAVADAATKAMQTEAARRLGKAVTEAMSGAQGNVAWVAKKAAERAQGAT